ncbi:MAG: GNAT family N-acetyltransferase [Treponema sp.]|jgi:acetyltransferase, GNAT family|uniref:GNAT family N-acetyltransferase n=1 Tax=Treponema sp. TaxID=166 RepID=UPI003FA2E9B7
MDFIHEDNRIYAENDAGKVIAEVTFPPEGETAVCLDHTFVDGSLRGQGVAGALVKEVVEYAQKNGKKIRPQCSYAVEWFNKHTEYDGLLVH